MERCGKGTSVKTHISDYSIIDLETTDVYIDCANIIEIAAIKVRNGVVVDRFSTLVNPLCHIPEAATAVNHITDEMVKNAPCLCEIIENFCSFIGNDVIVGYNNAAFDMNILYDSILEYMGCAFANNYIDVLYMARRCLKDLPNCKLETVSKYFGLDLDGEHRALKDCYLTKECYDKLYEEYGELVFNKNDSNQTTRRNQFSNETVLLKELHNILEAAIEDGSLSYDEFAKLNKWVTNNRNLQGHYPFDQVFNALDSVLVDGKIAIEELENLQFLFEEFVDPVEKLGTKSFIGDIKGTHICVTGEFEYGTRTQVFELIESKGGVVDKNIKKTTDFIIVGACGSENWKTGNYGGKIQKAMEFNQKGANIAIVDEEHFISSIEQDLSIEQKDNLSNELKSNYKQDIQDMLDAVVIQYGLLPGALSLCENYSRDRKRITSYSVYIYEHEYPQGSKKTADPTMRSNVLNLKIKGDSVDLIIATNQFYKIERPCNAISNVMKSEQNVQITFDSFSHELVEFIKKHTEYALDNYVSKLAAFGCCDLYNKCSNAKKCLHVNLLYSKACQYRKNLESGHVFYGDNKR